MSTLNEIAANHARMTNAVAGGTTERPPLLVVSFEPPALDGQQPVPLHLVLAPQAPTHFTCPS